MAFLRGRQRLTDADGDDDVFQEEEVDLQAVLGDHATAAGHEFAEGDCEECGDVIWDVEEFRRHALQFHSWCTVCNARFTTTEKARR